MLDFITFLLFQNLNSFDQILVMRVDDGRLIRKLNFKIQVIAASIYEMTHMFYILIEEFVEFLVE